MVEQVAEYQCLVGLLAFADFYNSKLSAPPHMTRNNIRERHLINA